MFSPYAVTKMKQALMPANKTLYMALFINTPNEWGTDAKEPNYTSYKRQPVVFNSTINEKPTPSTNEIIFPKVEAGGNGFAAAYYGLFDAPVGGNLIEWGQFVDASNQPSAQPIGTNTTAMIGIGGVLFGAWTNKVACPSQPCGTC